jgi:hypothetical protein
MLCQTHKDPTPHLATIELVEGATLILWFLHSFHSLPQAMSSPLQKCVYHWHCFKLGSVLAQRTKEVQNPNWTQLLPVANKPLEQVLTASTKEREKLNKAILPTHAIKLVDACHHDILLHSIIAF